MQQDIDITQTYSKERTSMMIKKEAMRIESIEVSADALEQSSSPGFAVVGFRGIGAGVVGSLVLDNAGSSIGVERIDWQDEGVEDIAQEIDASVDDVMQVLSEIERKVELAIFAAVGDELVADLLASVDDDAEQLEEALDDRFDELPLYISSRFDEILAPALERAGVPAEHYVEYADGERVECKSKVLAALKASETDGARAVSMIAGYTI